jgi:hypothetical protein
MLVLAKGQRNLLRVPGGAGDGVGAGVAVGLAVAVGVLPAVGVTPDVGPVERSTSRLAPPEPPAVLGAAVLNPPGRAAPWLPLVPDAAPEVPAT